MFLSIWGGVAADAVNRLKLLRFTRALFAVAGLLTAVLIALDILEVWHLLAISAFTGALLAFDIPTRGAMVASLVPKEQLPSAISLYSLVFGGAAILGPSLFHPIVTVVGMEGLFFIVSASYVFTVLTLMLMDPSRHRAASRADTAESEEIVGEDDISSQSVVPRGSNSESITVKARARVQDMVEGVKYVLSQPAIAALIGYGILIGLLATPLETLLPVVTEEIYKGDTATYGRLLLAIGIGGLIATFAITLIGTRAKPPLYLALGGTAVGVCYIAFAATDIFTYALIIAGIVGGLSVIKGTMSTTVVQTVTSDAFRGRVMSLMNFTWGAQAIGGLLMGTLAELWGAPVAFTFAGITAIAATLAVWTLALRRL